MLRIKNCYDAICKRRNEETLFHQSLFNPGPTYIRTFSSRRPLVENHSRAELQTPSSRGTSFSAVLEWLLERVNTRFLSTATPARPRAVLIITTKLPFVAAITRRRCRGRTPSIPSVGTERAKEIQREGASGEDKKRDNIKATRGKTWASDDSRTAIRSRTQFRSRVSRRQPLSESLWKIKHNV